MAKEYLYSDTYTSVILLSFVQKVSQHIYFSYFLLKRRLLYVLFVSLIQIVILVVASRDDHRCVRVTSLDTAIVHDVLWEILSSKGVMRWAGNLLVVLVTVWVFEPRLEHSRLCRELHRLHQYNR